jgi:hypothetical protein
MVFGDPGELLPSFRRNGSTDVEFGGKKFRMAVFRGDVANRGKGTLMVREDFGSPRKGQNDPGFGIL